MDKLLFFYTCDECGAKDVRVAARWREEGEEVVPWFEGEVVAAVLADHGQRSPECRPKTIRQIKLPAPVGDTGIGMRPEN